MSKLVKYVLLASKEQGVYFISVWSSR